MATHWNHLIDVIRMSTHNIRFCGEMRKITKLFGWKNNNKKKKKKKNTPKTKIPVILSRAMLTSEIHYVRRTIQKCAFGHMLTAKAQIRLRKCAAWSGPLLSANKIIG